jgi:hypothetical protein
MNRQTARTIRIAVDIDGVDSAVVVEAIARAMPEVVVYPIYEAYYVRLPDGREWCLTREGRVRGYCRLEAPQATVAEAQTILAVVAKVRG